MEPVRVLGYPVETVLAEKIATAIALGPANTRVRDYADIYTLTGSQPLAFRTAREALLATAAHRGTPVQRLSDAIGNIASLRSRTFEAYRASLGDAGVNLPAGFGSVVNAVTAFADPLAFDAWDATWEPTERRWS
jgi:nucleotidyltransferase AbiEii toxin of type IV toxin-antitoxin system